jgi:putative ABC transport system substrate-binding protein
LRRIDGWWKIATVFSMITRAALAAVLAFGLFAAPRATDGQEPGKVPRVGSLAPRNRSDGAPFLDAFRQGLRELGWVEGKNIVIEYRWAEGRSERLLDLAAELVRLNVDVILAANTSAVVAAKSATSTIPIVMAVGGSDPVGLGLVGSLARPGGNVTGLSFSVGGDIFGKGLELLRETVPKVRRVAVLSNPANPGQALAIRDVKVAARSLGVQLQLLETRGPNEFESAFAAMARERAGALFVVPDSMFGLNRARLQELAAKRRLPAMYGLREHTEAGGLMSYGVDVRDNFRRAATYTDKILKGARPADLPVEQPTKFELVINLKTAKALGLTIPPSVLLRVDEVIE